MTSTHEVLMCPKGHASMEADYCSECGVKIGGAGRSVNPGVGGSEEVQSHATQVCPDCGSSHEGEGTTFCDVCGYNFATGAHGEIALAPGPPPVNDVPDPSPEVELPVTSQQECATHAAWSLVVSVDPSLRGPDSPEPPPETPAATLALSQGTHLVGRQDETRAIFPEICLPLDAAVSRRHALVALNAEGQLSLRDIGAANGTKLNGVPLQAMQDYPLQDGDEITLGHWSRIRVVSQEPSGTARD